MSRQNYVCRDKIFLLRQNLSPQLCRNKYNFVAIKVLSRQAYFFRDSRDKMILVAASASDNSHVLSLSLSVPPARHWPLEVFCLLPSTAAFSILFRSRATAVLMTVVVSFGTQSEAVDRSADGSRSLPSAVNAKAMTSVAAVSFLQCSK